MAFPYGGGFGGGFGEGGPGGFGMPMMGGRCACTHCRCRFLVCKLQVVCTKRLTGSIVLRRPYLHMRRCRGFGQQNFSQRYHAVPVAAADKTDTKALEAGGQARREQPFCLRLCC